MLRFIAHSTARLVQRAAFRVPAPINYGLNFRPLARAIVGGVVIGSASVGCALCRSPDTPDYLVPYYLRDIRTRFNYYATLKSPDGKFRRMSPVDFLYAVLARPSKAPEDEGMNQEAALREFAPLFALADADADQTISFNEFAFLAVVLATDLAKLEQLFRLFDADGQGALTPQQFSALFEALSSKEMRPNMRSGLVRAMFLPDERDALLAEAPRSAKRAPRLPAEARCQFEVFRSVVDKVQRSISRAEFALYDADDDGALSPDEFGRLLLSSVVGRHLPFFLVDNLRRLGTSRPLPRKVSVDSYCMLTEIMGHADEVAAALQFIAASGFAVRASDLERVLNRSVALSRTVTADEVALLMALFDADRSGTLEVDEFVTLLRSKGSYAGILTEKKEPAFLPAQLAKCTAAAVRDVVGLGSSA
jgi:Ca2+-binding EF-hand superfamily protein